MSTLVAVIAPLVLGVLHVSAQTECVPCGTFVTQWGSLGSADGQFNLPTHVAVDGSGDVYVADLSNHRIQKFTGSGIFLTKWGSFGNLDGQFKGPSGVAIDETGNVYVADYGNQRIQKFTSTGAYVMQ